MSYYLKVTLSGKRKYRYWWEIYEREGEKDKKVSRGSYGFARFVWCARLKAMRAVKELKRREKNGTTVYEGELS